MDFKGKVALITGGAGGIGRATALAFARAGARVMVVDRDEQRGEDTMAQARAVGGGDARFTGADVARSSDAQAYVQATLDAFGRIDAFFNNAGIEGKAARIQEYDEALFDTVISVNLKGMFLGLRHVLPHMLEQGSGAVVNTSSIAGLSGSPGMAAYVASKHGVLGLTKVAALDVASQGVRVNAVCPGPVDTRMMRSLEAQQKPSDPDKAREKIQSSSPTGRYSMPEEVANAVLYLCSDLASNITGTQVVVDGGSAASGA